MSEWFYINQWKRNNSKIWSVVDMNGNIYCENVDRRTAEGVYNTVSDDPEVKCRVTVVHSNHSLYNKIKDNKLPEKNYENYSGTR